jgi:hypothetical protein
VPKASRGSPSSSLARGRSSHARSAEDLSRSGGSLSLAPYNGESPRRAPSPGTPQQKSYSAMRNSQSKNNFFFFCFVRLLIVVFVFFLTVVYFKLHCI